MFSLELTFTETEIIVSNLRDARNLAANSVRYCKNEIQKQAQKPFANCIAGTDSKTYYWDYLETEREKFHTINHLLVTQFGVDAKSEPQAEDFEPELAEVNES